MALLSLGSFVAILSGLNSRELEIAPRRKEAFLLSASALALVLGPVATVQPTFRFLIPVLPLLVCGGAIALEDLTHA